MGILIQYIANYAPWIYFVCGVIALYHLYRTWLVRAERRQAVFSLEREKAVRDMGSIFSTALLLLLAMGITYFTSTTLVKALEQPVQETNLPPGFPGAAEQLIPTPITTPLTPIAATMDAILAPTPTPLLQTTVEEPTATVDMTPSPLPPTSTPAPIVQSPICSDQGSVILRPGMNETVRGNISVVGTATRDNFQFYKIEYAPVGTSIGTSNWVYIAGDKNPVVNGFLADINTSTLGNGAWTLLLTVVDQTGNWLDPCQVNIFVEN